MASLNKTKDKEISNLKGDIIKLHDESIRVQRTVKLKTEEFQKEYNSVVTNYNMAIRENIMCVLEFTVKNDNVLNIDVCYNSRYDTNLSAKLKNTNDNNIDIKWGNGYKAMITVYGKYYYSEKNNEVVFLHSINITSSKVDNGSHPVNNTYTYDWNKLKTKLKLPHTDITDEDNMRVSDPATWFYICSPGTSSRLHDDDSEHDRCYTIEKQEQEHKLNLITNAAGKFILNKYEPPDNNHTDQELSILRHFDVKPNSETKFVLDIGRVFDPE